MHVKTKDKLLLSVEEGLSESAKGSVEVLNAVEM